MESNLWLVPLDELRERLHQMKHAKIYEFISGCDGERTGEQEKHFMGCSRCLIEDIIRQREHYEATNQGDI